MSTTKSNRLYIIIICIISIVLIGSGAMLKSGITLFRPSNNDDPDNYTTALVNERYTYSTSYGEEKTYFFNSGYHEGYYITVYRAEVVKIREVNTDNLVSYSHEGYAGEYLIYYFETFYLDKEYYITFSSVSDEDVQFYIEWHN